LLGRTDAEHQANVRTRLLAGEGLQQVEGITLVPPQRWAGCVITLERLRPGEQGVDSEQTAVGMTEQGLALRIDLVARRYQRLDLIFEEIQKALGATVTLGQSITGVAH